MSKTNGRMVVNQIDGRYGSFNTAILYSDIGNFVVNYDSLDEFSEGEYLGEFNVKNIYQKTRDFRVGKIVEPVAFIESIELTDASEGEQEELPGAIIDPLEEEIVNEELDLNNSDPDISESDKNGKSLFGELWPLDSEVKLDATVGRAQFRDQCEYLKSDGYVFMPKEQVWVK